VKVTDYGVFLFKVENEVERRTKIKAEEEHTRNQQKDDMQKWFKDANGRRADLRQKLDQFSSCNQTGAQQLSTLDEKPKKVSRNEPYHNRLSSRGSITDASTTRSDVLPRYKKLTADNGNSGRNTHKQTKAFPTCTMPWKEHKKRKSSIRGRQHC